MVTFGHILVGAIWMFLLYVAVSLIAEKLWGPDQPDDDSIDDAGPSDDAWDRAYDTYKDTQIGVDL